MSLSRDGAVEADQPAPIDRRLRIVGLILIYSICALGAWHPLNNFSDFWAHAAIGRWIVGHHWHAPRYALLLWSSHNAWIAHSWLSEALIYLLLHSAGDTGGPIIAIIIIGFIATVSFAVLWTLCKVNTRNFGPAVIVFTIAAYGTSGRLFARPEIFTILLFAILLYILVRRDMVPPAEKPSPRLLAAVLAPMFALWTNLHGGVLVGLITVWIYAISDLVQERLSQTSRVNGDVAAEHIDPRSMAGVAAICTAATLINPYGFYYYEIYRAVATLTFSHIVEWRPLFGYPYIAAQQLIPIVILVIAASVVWFFTPGRRWSHAGWLVVFVAMAVDARRNVGFVNLAALAVIAPYLRYIGTRQDVYKVQSSGRSSRGKGALSASSQAALGREGRRMWALAAGFIYLTMAWFSLDWLGDPDAPSALSPMLATGLCNAIKTIGIHGRVMNDYDYASYLEWKLDGDPQLFIDGLNAYPDSLFSDYMAILRAYPSGLKMLDDEHIDCIIGRGHVSTEPDFPTVYIVVAHSPAWALVYYGDDGPVWVRRLPQYRKYWEGVPVFAGGDTNDFILYLRTQARLRGRIQ